MKNKTTTITQLIYLLFFSFLITLSNVSVTYANTAIYVSPKGNDAAAGDINHPLKTIQKAIDTAGPGDTIFLRKGKYVGANTFTKSGTASANIVITGYENEKAVVTLPKKTSGAAFSLKGCDYITIKNLKISGLRARDVYGVLMEGGEKYITIENCEFTKIKTTKPGSKKKPGGNANAILLFGEGKTLDESISNIYITGNRIHGNRNGWSENISVAGNCEYIFVNDNKVYNNTNIGIDFYGNAEYCSDRSLDQPRHCECRNNKVYKCKSFYAHNAGIYVDGAIDILIEGNETYKNYYGIEIGSEEWRDYYDSNNLVRNITVRNNNLHNNKDCGLRIGGWSNDDTTGVVSDCLIENNSFKKDGRGTEIIISKCDNILFKNNDLGNNRTYEDVVYWDEAIDAEKITRVRFE